MPGMTRRRRREFRSRPAGRAGEVKTVDQLFAEQDRHQGGRAHQHAVGGHYGSPARLGGERGPECGSCLFDQAGERGEITFGECVELFPVGCGAPEDLRLPRHADQPGG
jgi:hypothetical protein